MQVINPTKEKLEVQIKGVQYEIEPEGSISGVPEEDARDWQEKTHKFIQLRKEKMEDKKEEVVEVPAPAVAEVAEAPVEETVAEEVATPKPEDATQAPVVDLKNEIKKGGRPKKVK